MTQGQCEGKVISRRSFLKMAAGAAAGAALFSLPVGLPAQAKERRALSFKAIGMKDIPNPVEGAKQSVLVQGAYEQILQMVDTIQDRTLKEATKGAIKNPVPLVAQEYTTKRSVTRIYQSLVDAGLVKPDLTHEGQLFPLLKDTSMAPQPFYSAPGSGYASHHAYPGGLATHVDVNLQITDAICKTYDTVFAYQPNRDVAIAAQALHDIAKPWVFQWKEDGSCLPEYTIAGTGAHHILSIAEVMYRGFPAEEVVAQACAHTSPSSPKEEEMVVGYIKAGAMIAGKDPIAYGVLQRDGMHLPTPHKQEGYIVHLGDHDFVLAVPAAQRIITVLKELAISSYGLSKTEADGAQGNGFRNYIGTQVSFMHLDHLLSLPEGREVVRRIVATIVRP